MERPKKVRRKCKRCGKRFTLLATSHAKYCSPECGHRSPVKRREAVHKNCVYCGAEFIVTWESQLDRKFCSQECYKACLKANNIRSLSTKPQSHQCLWCRRPYRFIASTYPEYCSVHCLNMHCRAYPEGEEQECPSCGKVFTRTRNGRICCSDECERKHYSQLVCKEWENGRQSFAVHKIRSGKRVESDAFGGLKPGAVTHKVRRAIEEHLGRPLSPRERIWRLDGDDTNDDFANLYLFDSKEEHFWCARSLRTKSNLI